MAAKKRQSRRAKGVKIPDVPMFLDSDVHVSTRPSDPRPRASCPVSNRKPLGRQPTTSR
jgi:hypothetical protein